MITEYHIDKLLKKMDEQIEVGREILAYLKANKQVQQSTAQLEVKMGEETNNTEQQTPESVTITQTDEPTVTTLAEVAPADNTKVAEPKQLSKTKKFEGYRAAGGKLSWNKWKAAGMPLKPDDNPVP